ncbi:hypothetical protein LINPERHAP1_LOCUS548 [Linum perenne]
MGTPLPLEESLEMGKAGSWRPSQLILELALLCEQNYGGPKLAFTLLGTLDIGKSSLSWTPPRLWHPSQGPPQRILGMGRLFIKFWSCEIDVGKLRFNTPSERPTKLLTSWRILAMGSRTRLISLESYHRMF